MSQEVLHFSHHPTFVYTHMYVKNILRNEGTHVPTYLPFIYYLSYVCKLIHVVNVCLCKTPYKVFSSRILALFFSVLVILSDQGYA